MHRTTTSKISLAALFLVIGCRGAFGLIPRNVAVDVGFGVPHLIFGQGIVKVSDHWQIGLGYGIIPGLAAVGQNISLGQQTLTLGGTTEVQVTPTLNVALNTLLPFVRYFPKENNFYIQATYSMWQLSADISGTFKTPEPVVSTVGLMSGTATVTQPIPTISVGHVWSGSIYFCDLSLGFSFFLPASATVSIQSLIPDALGGSEGNTAVINEMASTIESEVNSATSVYRTQYPIVPSISFTFGFLL